MAKDLIAQAEAIQQSVARAASPPTEIAAVPPGVENVMIESAPPRLPEPQAEIVEQAAPAAEARKPLPKLESKTSGSTGLSNPQQKLLDTLAAMAALGLDLPSREQLALFRGIRASTGSFNADMTALKNARLIEYVQAGILRLTNAGIEAARPAAMPRTRAELHRQCLAKLSNPQAGALRLLLTTYPKSLTREQIAQGRGVKSNTGSFNADLTALRNMGFAVFPVAGEVRAAKLLFPKGLP